jgi:hypothetical protein
MVGVGTGRESAVGTEADIVGQDQQNIRRAFGGP